MKLFHELGESEAAKSAFFKELSVLCTLHHKNIVSFLGASTTLPYLCLVQVHPNGDSTFSLYFFKELAEQGTLFDMIHDHRVRPQYGKLLQILTEIARAMNYCHCHTPPIVHRDLKTKNVLLNASGEVLLADFGISRFKEHSVLETNHPRAGTE